MNGKVLRERLTAWAWAVEEWWERHVTMRELHRRLDAARAAYQAAFPKEWNTPEYQAESLRRLAVCAAQLRKETASGGPHDELERNRPDGLGR